MIRKYLDSGHVEIGEDIPPQGVAYLVGGEFGWDPDLPAPTSHTAFTLPHFDGCLFKVVKDVGELEQHGAYLFWMRDRGFVCVTQKSIDYSSPDELGHLPTLGNLGSVTLAPQPLNKGAFVWGQTYGLPYIIGRAGTQVFAWITGAEYGLITAAETSSETTFSLTPTGELGNGYRGFAMNLIEVEPLKDVILRHAPKVLADAPNSKVRKCLTDAINTELASMQDEMLKIPFGVTYSPSQTREHWSLAPKPKVGALGYDTRFATVGTGESYSTAGYKNKLNRTMNQISPHGDLFCTTFGGVFDQRSTDYMVSNILRGYSIVEGNDLLPDLRTISNMSAEHLTNTIEEYWRAQVEFVSLADLTPEAVEGLANSSPNSFLFGNPARTVGSAGAIDVFRHVLGFKQDLLVGRTYYQIANTWRRIYARAEQYAKKYA